MTWPVVAPHEIFDYNTDGQIITRAEVSREVLKHAAPEQFWRTYTSKDLEWRVPPKSGLQTMRIKAKSNAHSANFKWKEVGELEPLPNAQIEFKEMVIQVTERGKAFPWTERTELATAIDVAAVVKEFAKDVIIVNINRDLARMFLYLDILAICRSGANVGTNKIVEGKSLLKTRQFNNGHITVSQASIDTNLGTIEGEALGKLTMENILNLVTYLSSSMKVPSRSGKGWGTYTIIINEKAYANLISDPVFRDGVKYGDPARLFGGTIGTFYGQEFVKDTSGMINLILADFEEVKNTGDTDAQAQAKANFLKDKAIAILISNDPVAESVLLPEQVTNVETNPYYRQRSAAIRTYRGETPTWFASVDGVGAGAVMIGL